MFVFMLKLQSLKERIKNNLDLIAEIL